MNYDELESEVTVALKSMNIDTTDVERVQVNKEAKVPATYLELWRDRGYQVEPAGCMYVKFVRSARVYIYPLNVRRLSNVS